MLPQHGPAPPFWADCMQHRHERSMQACAATQLRSSPVDTGRLWRRSIDTFFIALANLRFLRALQPAFLVSGGPGYIPSFVGFHSRRPEASLVSPTPKHNMSTRDSDNYTTRIPLFSNARTISWIDGEGGCCFLHGKSQSGQSPASTLHIPRRRASCVFSLILLPACKAEAAQAVRTPGNATSALPRAWQAPHEHR